MLFLLSEEKKLSKYVKEMYSRKCVVSRIGSIRVKSYESIQFKSVQIIIVSKTQLEYFQVRLNLLESIQISSHVQSIWFNFSKSKFLLCNSSLAIVWFVVSTTFSREAFPDVLQLYYIYNVSQYRNYNYSRGESLFTAKLNPILRA